MRCPLAPQRSRFEPRERQFYGLPASHSALLVMARAFDGKAPVIFDSGIRHGTDVLRALALGADAVVLGRTYCMAWPWEAPKAFTWRWSMSAMNCGWRCYSPVFRGWPT